MAKKKTSSDAATQDTTAASKRKSPAKAPEKKAAKPGASTGGSPMVDTTLAAQSAAKMLVGRSKLQAGIATLGDAAKESGSFKQLKEGLNKPAGTGVTNFLNSTPGTAKSSLPTHHNQQHAHNQTSANFTRTGVPRRTNG